MAYLVNIMLTMNTSSFMYCDLRGLNTSLSLSLSLSVCVFMHTRMQHVYVKITYILPKPTQPLSSTTDIVHTSSCQITPTHQQ